MQSSISVSTTCVCQALVLTMISPNTLPCFICRNTALPSGLVVGPLVISTWVLVQMERRYVVALSFVFTVVFCVGCKVWRRCMLDALAHLFATVVCLLLRIA